MVINYDAHKPYVSNVICNVNKYIQFRLKNKTVYNSDNDNGMLNIYSPIGKDIIHTYDLNTYYCPDTTKYSKLYKKEIAKVANKHSFAPSVIHSIKIASIVVNNLDIDIFANCIHKDNNYDAEYDRLHKEYVSKIQPGVSEWCVYKYKFHNFKYDFNLKLTPSGKNVDVIFPDGSKIRKKIIPYIFRNYHNSMHVDEEIINPAVDYDDLLLPAIYKCEGVY
jgi:hypothetical protein